MGLPDDRLDALIDDVARAMTSDEPRDLARDVVRRVVDRRGRRRWLVPALAAAAVAAAAVGVTLMRAPAGRVVPTPSNAPPLVARATTSNRGAAQGAAPTPRGGAPATPSSGRTARSAPRSLAEPLPPPFVTDLSPRPLEVDPVDVSKIEMPGNVYSPPLGIDPLIVTPIDDQGGVR